MKIILFIRSLESGGGAERQLLYLAKFLAKYHQVTIITFYSTSPENEYKILGLDQNTHTTIQIVSLKKKSRYTFFSFLLRYFITAYKIKPDITYAFMNIPSILAVFPKLFLKRSKVVWGIRSSNLDLQNYNFLNKLATNAENSFSIFADKIISNSSAGKNYAISRGYSNKSIDVVYNGIDTCYFTPSLNIKENLLSKLNLPQHSKLIGLVGRHDPMKGIEYFLEAANILNSKFKNIYFLVIGSGPMQYSQKLKKTISNIMIEDKIIWIEKNSDILTYYRALDIFTSSSIYGEGFPNVIAEAMSCGIPSVATDVGDSKVIIGNVGKLVSPKNAIAISDAWEEILNLNTDEIINLSQKSRERIINNFSIDTMATKTKMLLEQII